MESLKRELESKPRRLSSAMVHWFRQEVIDTPLTPSLQPTRLRLQLFGSAILVGHPLFWLIWAVLLPQPYENLTLRILMSSLGLLFFTKRVLADPGSTYAARVTSAVLWMNLPFTFWWMYLCNGGNHVWIASMAAMTLIYYAMTDWRLATVGIGTAGLISGALFKFVATFSGPIHMPTHIFYANVAIIGFCIAMGIILGMSIANLRREQLSATLVTMGIMAHELRTPLATVTLIGDAIHGVATNISDEDQARELKGVANRLQDLVRSMNHQLNTQMANARLLRLPESKEMIRASTLLKRRLEQYPFRSARERACVTVRIKSDFRFVGAEALFGQVVDNLLKNALRSLAAAGSTLQEGDVVIEVEKHEDHGRISVRDRGIGIDRSVLARVFEPFFSTNQLTGHGLGLAFCKRVVDAAKGSISVESTAGQGATFVVDLPLSTEARPETMPASLSTT
jgi:two-component system CAI-1 autoinducer sensor kinase/phosphatase CqsS